MKGIVFTELLNMVEEVFSMSTANKIVDSCELPSGGVYTSIGTYELKELLLLLKALSRETNLPIPKLVHAYGHRLFGRFYDKFPHFFYDVPNAFSFLMRVEDYIHVEVLKLYPDATLPSFDWTLDESRQTMTLFYQSPRCLGDLAEGLIQGCIEHYGEEISLAREDMGDDGSIVRFELAKLVSQRSVA